MRVLGIGESVVDTTEIVQQHPGKKPEIIASHQDAGGPVLSAMMFLSKLGHTCSFVTSLGNDQESKLISNTLLQGHVELIAYEQQRTKKHHIVVNALNGQRQKFRDATTHKPISNIDPSYIKQFDLIVFDRHERSAFREVVKHKRPDTHIISDPSTEVSDYTMDMIRTSTCPIVPIEFLTAFGGDRSLSGALRGLFNECGKPFVVTMGELGSLIYDGRRPTLVPALAIRCIDANGAGDVYRGAFAHMLGKDSSLLTSAQYANTAAAVHCTKKGNAAAVPSSKDIQRHIHGNTRRNVSIDDVESCFSNSPQSAQTADPALPLMYA